MEDTKRIDELEIQAVGILTALKTKLEMEHEIVNKNIQNGKVVDKFWLDQCLRKDLEELGMVNEILNNIKEILEQKKKENLIK